MNHQPGYLNQLQDEGLVRPLGDAFAALYAALWLQPHIPPSTLELCRLRLAQLHRSPLSAAEQGAPISEAARNALSGWHSSEEFSAGQKACLAFTEVYVQDCAAITDDHAAAVKTHFGDTGLMLLIEALGLLDGMVRLGLLWPPSSVEGRVRE